ncbi:hypothetical protein GTI81_09080 [Enterococcus faecalis]|uniref:Thoeris protein ThsB TIR-like domain-containing protein n=1 Tax=Enterococcus faecalis TaxID=1351 RepID=A0AAP6RHN6_ENTFL|nr:TIR domain-containing protein [Enterococcus faecalis]MXS28384.1 hypothetical protein [Enterococcus faecalis]MXS52863.1 hypothetical protein [Enterococcus faecalis]
MKRSVFYSFHYLPDNWRVGQIRNMGVVEGNSLATDNDWEKVKQAGNSAIQNWIDNQLKGRSCTVLLIGENTAGRKWINYEIEKSWNDGKGIVGIYIHNLKDRQGYRSSMGKNPFVGFSLNNGTKLSSVVKAYNPPFTDSKMVYNYIASNLSGWIEEAIRIRKNA